MEGNGQGNPNNRFKEQKWQFRQQNKQYRKNNQHNQQMGQQQIFQQQQEMQQNFQEMNQHFQDFSNSYSQQQNLHTNQYMQNQNQQQQYYEQYMPRYQQLYHQNHFSPYNIPKQSVQQFNQNIQKGNDNYENNYMMSRKQGKINPEENKQLLDHLFQKDNDIVQSCLKSQEVLATSLRKGECQYIKAELKKKYKQQLNYLKQNGFRNATKILLKLQEEEGNEERVLRKLVLQTLEEKSSKITYEKQLQELQQNYQYKNCKRRMISFLKETKGDIQKSRKLYEIDQQNRKQLELIYKSQLQTLALDGWLNPSTKKVILKILHKYDGDLEKSRNEISMKCFHKIKSLTQSELKQLNDFKCNENFNEKITDVVIDGNNLLFMNSDIRNNCINKQRETAERKICALARQFKEITDLNSVIVIFDQMHQEIVDTKIQIINCKNTKFSTSDDFIVDHTQKLSNEQINKTMIITSDQELTYRLISIDQNISIMKGKVYFQKIEELLSNDIFKEIVTNNNI